eukprot:TRINITY_DN67669_c11_g1_i1.p1 TRINITY_DN67669_c11_g1~~TRINITY_DN67669_c11_g1_i1.p1  ORF type:complete len:418 (-),score=249.98 TRINITY_DN67669_c11_g1_i1:847-2049(-)
MSTYVVVSDEDPALDLAALLGRLQGGKRKARLRELAEDGECGGLIEEGLLAQLDALWDADEATIDLAFNLSFALLERTEDKQFGELVSRFVKVLSGERHFRLKLPLLATLYNLLPADSPRRYDVFMAILQYAQQLKKPEVVVSQFDTIDALLASWASFITDRQRSDLLLLVAQLALDAHLARQHHEFLRKYLTSLNGADDKTLASAHDYVVASLKRVVSTNVDLAEADRLLSLDAVQCLKRGSAADKKLVALVEIIVGATVAEYLRFADDKSEKKEADAAAEQLGSSRDELLSLMRTLTLCSQAAQSSTATYAQLKESLCVKTDDELEAAVVNAVATGLIEATLDQETTTVEFSRAEPRAFDADNTWNDLNTKLASWKRNIAHVLGVVHQSRNADKDAEE